MNSDLENMHIEEHVLSGPITQISEKYEKIMPGKTIDVHGHPLYNAM